MKAAVKDFVQLERLAQQMDARGLNAIVARAGINFTYLAGFAYPGTLARHLDLADSPRGVYLIWPRIGEPRIVVNAIAEGLARRDSFVEHFDVYEGYTEPPIEKLASVIAAMGLAESNVGFETNFISAADWETLHTRLPKMQMTNSTEMMDVVRAVKTPSELAYLKRGADMLDDAFLACFPLVRPGMRERDLHAALVGYCLSHGSEFTHGILNSERNTIQYAGESDFAFAAGDAIRTDYVAYMQGYAPAVAVEFALVAPVFFALLFAILETAIMFFAGQALEVGTQDSARLLLTHQAQDSGMTETQFKTDLCNRIMVLFNCTGNLANITVDVKVFPPGTAITITDPIVSGNLTGPFAYQLPPTGSPNTVVVRAFYQWPLFVTGLGYNISNLNGSQRLLAATAAFHVEP